jgi:CheY-like chemotaxis protein
LYDARDDASGSRLLNTRLTVLVIDDDPSTRSLVAETLRLEFDVDVRGACDGREGILTIASEPPSLILLDMRMPGIDGLGVLHWLKSSPRTSTIPVLALTTTTNPATLHSLERRCDGVIVKPFDIEDLLDVVRTYLERSAIGEAPTANAR